MVLNISMVVEIKAAIFHYRVVFLSYLICLRKVSIIIVLPVPLDKSRDGSAER